VQSCLACSSRWATGRYGWGAGLLVVSTVSAAFTVLYAWRRNLPVNVAIHALIDAIGLFLVPSLAHTKMFRRLPCLNEPSCRSLNDRGC